MPGPPVLSTAGGLVGVGLGGLAARQLSKRFSWPLLIRPDIILVAVGVHPIEARGYRVTHRPEKRSPAGRSW